MIGGMEESYKKFIQVPDIKAEVFNGKLKGFFIRV